MHVHDQYVPAHVYPSMVQPTIATAINQYIYIYMYMVQIYLSRGHINHNYLAMVHLNTLIQGRYIPHSHVPYLLSRSQMFLPMVHIRQQRVHAYQSRVKNYRHINLHRVNVNLYMSYLHIQSISICSE